MEETILTAKDLKFRYDPEQPDYALNGVSAEVKRGEFVAVLGANGCGKSTLAKHFNAILLPESGTVLVEGMDTKDEDKIYDIRQTVGMVFQSPDNQIVATVVEEDVAFALENLGVPPEEMRRRVDDAYRRVPGLRALDQTLQQQMITLVGLTMRHGSDPTDELRALERANLDTQAQRAELLTSYHLPVDYTDDIYTCPDCRDTGYIHAQPCRCLLRRYNAELTRDLSRLLQSGDESFEHFDLTLYDESARPKMERVFQVCRSFAQTFRPGTMNLLLQGGTGLGKTYLSACIARVVAGAGYAVAYETAASALDAFECAKFQRSSADGEAAAQRVEQYLGCDLMILDDLGTEMITAYSTSALYTLINTRLTRAKATIISTNCSNEELQKKYTPQILSRIAGEYQTLPFVGRDIRQIKKEREA